MVAKTLQTLFDILPTSERPLIQRAFSTLEQDKIPEAISQFQSFVSGDFSEYCKSFANYGTGVAYYKKNISEGLTSLGNIDVSIDHLEASLKILEHSDAHLMLGYALRQKITYRFTHESEIENNYRELIGLITRAMQEFERAAQLNRGYSQISQEELASLNKEKSSLEKRLNRIISLGN